MAEEMAKERMEKAKTAKAKAARQELPQSAAALCNLTMFYASLQARVAEAMAGTGNCRLVAN